MNIGNNITSRAITLAYNATLQQQVFVTISFKIKQVIMKQVMVVNPNTSTPTSFIGYIQSNIMEGPPNNALCSVCLETSTAYSCDLDVMLKPVSANINETYNFNLIYSDSVAFSGVANLNASIILLLEFHD